MPIVNQVTLSGNVSRDGRMESTHKGGSVLTFTMAVNERIPVNNSRDEWTERAHFFDVRAYGRLAEINEFRMRKGLAIAVFGKLRHDSWENPEGQRRNAIRIVANSILIGADREMLDDLDAMLPDDEEPAA